MKADPLKLESQNQAKNITVVLPNQQGVFELWLDKQTDTQTEITCLYT